MRMMTPTVRPWYGMRINNSSTPKPEWTPMKLFADGHQGFWSGGYDPALGRMWQDSAGLTPVTSPGQPVGKVVRAAGTVDASQATALSRPTLARWPKGGRRNFLTWTEDFENSDWTKIGVTVSGQKLTEGEGDGIHGIRNPASAGPVASVYTTYFDVKAAERTLCEIWVLSVGMGVGAGARFNLATGEVVSNRAASSSSYIASSIEPLGDGVFRCSVTVNYSGEIPNGYLFPIADGTATNTVSYMGDGTSGIFVYRSQLELGPTATDYQRVTSAYDITEEGVQDVWHLWNDGGDSLPITLPAGTYGRARVNDAGLVTVDTVVDPVDALASNQQVDVILQQGAFTPEEEAQIRTYWARYAA